MRCESEVPVHRSLAVRSVERDYRRNWCKRGNLRRAIAAMDQRGIWRYVEHERLHYLQLVDDLQRLETERIELEVELGWRSGGWRSTLRRIMDGR